MHMQQIKSPDIKYMEYDWEGSSVSLQINAWSMGYLSKVFPHRINTECLLRPATDYV